MLRFYLLLRREFRLLFWFIFERAYVDIIHNLADWSVRFYLIGRLTIIQINHHNWNWNCYCSCSILVIERSHQVICLLLKFLGWHQHFVEIAFGQSLHCRDSVYWYFALLFKVFNILIADEILQCLYCQMWIRKIYIIFWKNFIHLRIFAIVCPHPHVL